jgi:hypothetical protein
MFKNLPPNKTREAYVTSGPSETKIEILTGSGQCPLQFTKIFGNFFGNSEVKMSLNVENGICQSARETALQKEND